VGGDGKAERREASSLVSSLPIMPSRAFFPREDDWGRVSGERLGLGLFTIYHKVSEISVRM